MRAPNPKVSTLEAAFDQAWRLLRPAWAPMPVGEFRFCPERRWRADRAFPDAKVIVELEGAIWTRGRHARGAGMLADMDKYNWLAANGWLVLRYAANHLRVDPARVVEQVASALRDRSLNPSTGEQRC